MTDNELTLQNSLRQSFDEGEPPIVVHQKGRSFAAVEGGGTTFRVAISVGDPTNITEVTSIDTTTPEETLGKVCEWLRTKRFDAIGDSHCSSTPTTSLCCMNLRHESL